MRSEDGTCLDLASADLASAGEEDGGVSEVLTDQHATGDAEPSDENEEKEGDEGSDESEDGEEDYSEDDDAYYDEPNCYDEGERCAERALNNGCVRNFAEMSQTCRETCLLCPTAQGLQSVRNMYSDVPQGWMGDEELLQYFDEIDEYMYGTVYAGDTPEYVKLHCRNREPDCSYWSWNGECETSPEFMLESCAAACMDCSKSSEQAIRCPFDKDEHVLWRKGDLQRMFTRLVTSPDFAIYNPMVASRPLVSPNPKFGGMDGPWIVVLDNFLSDAECQKLIKLGVNEGFEKASQEEEEEGLEVGRSLSTRLCVGNCAQSTVVTAVEERLVQLTGVPVQHQEPMELHLYADDDYHNLHSDYAPHEFSKSQGPRILTVVLFLNDLTKGGGDDTSGGVYFESIETVSLWRAVGSVLLVPEKICCSLATSLIIC
jgi:prolyl 4-hydroxylase